MIKKTQKRAEMANMVRAFLLQAFHGDVDRQLAQHLYKAVNELEPPTSQADWTGDLAGSGYDIDRTLTREAQEALGPVYRVLADDAGGRWLHDTRTITEFLRMGTETEARGYIGRMAALYPDLRRQIIDAISPRGPVVGLVVNVPAPVGVTSEGYATGYAEALARTASEVAAAYQQGYADALQEHHAAIKADVWPDEEVVVSDSGSLQAAVQEYAEIVDDAAKVAEAVDVPPPMPEPLPPPDPLPGVAVDPLFNIEH